MNTLTVILLIYILVEVLLGCRRGFFSSVLSLIVMVLTMVSACWFSPWVANYLEQKTRLPEMITERLERRLEQVDETGSDKNKDTESRSWQQDFFESAGFPSYLSQILNKNNNVEFFNALKVDTFYRYIAAYLANVIINIIAFLMTFFVIWIVLHLLAKILNGFCALPILRGLNRFGGMIFGAGKALLMISIFLLLVTMFSTTDFGQVLVSQIEESPVLSTFYAHNPLVAFITDITRQIFS